MAARTNTTVTGTARCPAGVTDCFIPYPDVDTRWTRFTADLRYFFQQKVGVGFSFWYQDQNRLDFATIDTNGSVAFTTPTDVARVDYLGGLVTGYGARPYRGVTTFVRLLYRFSRSAKASARVGPLALNMAGWSPQGFRHRRIRWDARRCALDWGPSISSCPSRRSQDAGSAAPRRRPPGHHGWP